MALNSEKTKFKMSLLPNNRISNKLFLIFLSLFLHLSSFAQTADSANAAAGSTAPVAGQATGAAAGGGAAGGADPALVQQGASIFKQNCASCHAINDVVIGPALKDLHKRRDLKWVIKFVHNSQQVILNEKDPYAVELYNKYNQTVMPSFPGLSDEEINAIFEFVKAESTAPAPAQTPAGGTAQGGDQAAAGGDGGKYSTITLILIIVVLILVAITLLVFITVIRRYLKDREATLAEEDRDIVNQKFDIGAVIKSRMFLSIVGFIFICAATRACWNELLYIGVEQGYQPVQPIPFSHELHAGQYKIDCNYCHTGVRKGKQANVPSVNICMNCHNTIKKGPKFGEEAIAKVVKAYEENKPIKWIRVHNLPDLAYFNHAQHVNVAGIECQRCHGPVETMEVVRQHAPLTMGWCINCHRETSVNGADNAYYDRLIELHSTVSKKELKVADIGGLECSKCHY